MNYEVLIALLLAGISIIIAYKGIDKDYDLKHASIAIILALISLSMLIKNL